jgi:hypothetical protein
MQSLAGNVRQGLDKRKAASLSEQLLGQASQATAEPPTVEQQASDIQSSQIDLAERQEVEQTQQAAQQKRDEIQRQNTMRSIQSDPELSGKLSQLQQINPQMAQGVTNVLLSRDAEQAADLQNQATLANKFQIGLAQAASDPKVNDDGIKSIIRNRARYLDSQGVGLERIAPLMSMDRDELISWGRSQAAMSQGAYNVVDSAKKTLGIGKIDPEKYTPDSLQTFQSTGDYSQLQRLAEPEGDDSPAIGTPSPKDFTVDSIAEYQQTGDPSVLSRYHSQSDKRGQLVITQGLAAAQSVPTLRRSLELLDSVKTGGLAAAQLKAKQVFGIEGADEAELSTNLGRNVLGQLKETFGSAFTEGEGDRLIKLEAGLGKSAAGNKRIVTQLLKMAELKVRQGKARANSIGDDATISEMDEYLNFKLDGSALESSGNDDNELFDKYGLN